MTDFKKLAQHLDIAEIHDTYLAFFKRGLTPHIYNNFISIKDQYGQWHHIWGWAWIFGETKEQP